MTSPFVNKPDITRQRAASNGGLWGFVAVRNTRAVENQQGDGRATWPRNRRIQRNKPAPISIVQESNKFFVKQELLSTVALPHRTPVSWYNALLTPSSVYSDVLPPTPENKSRPSPLELPGSLLLPSQGFPQSNPPCTPARLPALSRSSSEESDRSWTPAVSIYSATDIEEDEMPKSFPPKHLPRATKPSKMRNFSAPATHELGIGKPVSAMNVDELLEELPQLSSDAVKSVWVPAMTKQHEKIRMLLQGAADVRFGTNSDVYDFGQTLESLSRDARKISYTYEKAVKSTESLLERDMKMCRDRLNVTENNLAAALTTVDKNQQVVRQKDETIQQLRYTLDDVVRVLGDFIQNYMPASVLRCIDQGSVRDVMQMLTDYKDISSLCDEPTMRFLRVPEEHYMGNIDALKESQLKTERFRDVAINQSQMISEQSAQLDSRLAAYEKSMRVIAERNHEVQLLAEDNTELRKTLDAFETGLRVSDSTKIVQDELYRDQEAMHFLLKDTKASHVQELQQRDSEISDLKKQLGNAKQEVQRGKLDVKNVITHTQALLSPAQLSEESGHKVPTLRERRMRSKTKGQPVPLPTSQSMLPLSSQSQKPSIPERRQSANVLGKLVNQPTVAMMPRDVTPQWACGVSQKRGGQHAVDASDFSPSYAPRPRSDSLDYSSDEQHQPGGDHMMASAVVNHMLGAPLEFDPNKKLPNRPEPHYALDIYGAVNAPSMQEAEDWYQQQHPQLPQHVPTASFIQRKRVLSQITERSIEDSASEKNTASATSSAEDAYRNGVQAVRMRDFIDHTNSIIKGEGKGNEPDAGSDHEGRGYYVPLTDTKPEEGDIHVAKSSELVQNPVKHLQYAKEYEDSQNSGSGSTMATKKNSPLRDVEGLRVGGDPWLSGSPAHR